MKASEHIQRIKDLIEIAGDVEIVISVNDCPYDIYEEARFEIQNVAKLHDGVLESLDDGNKEQVIKVFQFKGKEDEDCSQFDQLFQQVV